MATTEHKKTAQLDKIDTLTKKNECWQLLWCSLIKYRIRFSDILLDEHSKTHSHCMSPGYIDYSAEKCSV